MLEVGSLVGYKFGAFGENHMGVGKIEQINEIGEMLVSDKENDVDWILKEKDIVMVRVK